MDITQILVAAIGVIGTVIVTIITSVLVPWLKSNTSETAQAILTAVAQSAVLFVQQTMTTESGEEKLEIAIATVQNYLAEYDISFDEEVIRAEIESALKQLKLESGESWN